MKKTITLLAFLAYLGYGLPCQATPVMSSERKPIHVDRTHRFQLTLPVKEGQTFAVAMRNISCLGISSRFHHHKAVFPVECYGDETGAATATVTLSASGKIAGTEMRVDFADGKKIGLRIGEKPK